MEVDAKSCGECPCSSYLLLLLRPKDFSIQSQWSGFDAPTHRKAADLTHAMARIYPHTTEPKVGHAEHFFHFRYLAPQRTDAGQNFVTYFCSEKHRKTLRGEYIAAIIES